jgi:S1-C subfamily serine protease
MMRLLKSRRDPGGGISHELLNASAKAEASVTNGAISGFKQDRAGQTVIQTDAPAALGNSGGPAVDDEGCVIGVLTFVTEGNEGGIVQGFNFVIPVKAVRKFLAGTEAKPDQSSNFDRAWQAGGLGSWANAGLPLEANTA